MNPRDKAPSPAQLAADLAQAVTLIEPLLEAVQGYRARCVAAGFGETAAEAMAVQLHHKLLGG